MVEFDPLSLRATVGVGGDPPPRIKYDFTGSWKDFVIVMVSFSSIRPTQFAWPEFIAHEALSPTKKSVNDGIARALDHRGCTK